MPEDFYHQWLSIPPGPRPPDHYALLGVERFCRDADAIEAAARRQLTRLDEYAMHPDRATRDAVQDMMNEVARARVDLVNPSRRQAYDTRLAREPGVAVLPQPQAAEPGTAEPGPAPEEDRGPARAGPDKIDLFRATVWAHLRKWRRTPHEDRLLVVEADCLGIDADSAMEIIRRIDEEAEALADRKHKRIVAIAVGCALAAVVGAGGFLVYWQGRQGRLESRFTASISRAQEALARTDLDAAAAALAEAGKVFPEDHRYIDLRNELSARREALDLRLQSLVAEAKSCIEQGDFQQARAKLAEAKRIAPGDARFVDLQKKLAAAQDAAARVSLLAAEAYLNSGNLAAAREEFAQAGRIGTSEPKNVKLRGRIGPRLKEMEKQFQATLSEAKACFERGEFNGAAARLGEASSTFGRDARLIALRTTVQYYLSPPGKLALSLPGGVRMELALVPAGTFLMGSPPSAPGHGDDEGPQRAVTIGQWFHLAATEVTRAQWRAVMDTEPWKSAAEGATAGGDLPVTSITWDQAAAFCRTLSRKLGESGAIKAGAEARLPTEAEWEYACRAGTQTPFFYGTDATKLGRYAWYGLSDRKPAEARVHAVATKEANPWGLFDMCGNAQEWCSDWYDKAYFAEAENADPKGPATGTFRALRGGSWASDANGCRSACRGFLRPGEAGQHVGFRIVVAWSGPRPTGPSVTGPDENEKKLLGLLAAANACLADDDIEGARKKLAEAKRIVPNDPRLATALQQLALADRTRLPRSIKRGLEYLYSAQKADGSWDTKYARRFGGGVAALVLWTALSAGEDPADAKLTAALKHVRGLKPEPQTVYVRAARAIAFARLPGAADADRLAEDVRWLAENQSDTGGWGYGPGHATTRESPKWTDISNTFLAMLALREAELAGAKTPAEVWDRCREYLFKAGNPDGGFGYQPPGERGFRLRGSSYGSMTAAGASAMLLLADRWAEAGEKPFTEAGSSRINTSPFQSPVDRALRWLSANYTLARNPKWAWLPGEAYEYYYLFVLGRLADEAGLARVGPGVLDKDTVDLILSRQQAKGSWINPAKGEGRAKDDLAVIRTCFALLALTRANRPIVIQKLALGGRAANDSRDVAHLVEWVSRTSRRPGRWRQVTPQTPAEELAASQVLYIQATTTDWPAALGPKIVAFVRGGGTVLVQPFAGDKALAESAKAYFRRLLPDCEHGRVPVSHPVFSTPFKLPPTGRPGLYGFGDGKRTCVYLLNTDVSGAWHQRRLKTHLPLFQFGANLLSRAAAKP